MDIATTCPGCRTPVLIDAGYAGRQVRCGACDRVFVAVPDAAPPVARPPADIETACPDCAARLEIEAAFADRPVRCPRCNGVFTATPLHPVAPPPAYRPYQPYRAYRPYPAYRPPPPPTGGMAVASLVCGLAANVSWCCAPAGFVLGLVAIVLGWPARTGPKGGLAAVGFVTGAVAVALAAVWSVVVMVMVIHHGQTGTTFR